MRDITMDLLETMPLIITHEGAQLHLILEVDPKTLHWYAAYVDEWFDTPGNLHNTGPTIVQALRNLKSEIGDKS